MKKDTLNAKQIEYRVLQKQIKGISPKVSTYKILEDKIKKLAEELGYGKIKEVKKPNWDKNVQVLHHKHKITEDPNVKTDAVMFEAKKSSWGKFKKWQSQ